MEAEWRAQEVSEGIQATACFCCCWYSAIRLSITGLKCRINPLKHKRNRLFMPNITYWTRDLVTSSGTDLNYKQNCYRKQSTNSRLQVLILSLVWQQISFDWMEWGLNALSCSFCFYKKRQFYFHNTITFIHKSGFNKSLSPYIKC